MPVPLLQSYSKKSKRSLEDVEKYWDWAKQQATKKFNKKGPAYWAYVNKLTEIRLGLKKIGENFSFKEFLYNFNKKER